MGVVQDETSQFINKCCCVELNKFIIANISPLIFASQLQSEKTNSHVKTLWSEGISDRASFEPQDICF